MNQKSDRLVILHGALGSATQLKSLEDELASYFEIINIDLPGHGSRSMEETEFSIPLFAEDVADRLRSGNADNALFFGYSMGGYVALYLAHKYPELVKGVITLATKFNWDREGALRESAMLDPGMISEKFPAYAASLEERHRPGNWKDVLANTSKMMISLGDSNTFSSEDYAAIDRPCLLMLGDRDKMVGIEETDAVYKKLPVAQMAVLPGTPHPFEKVSLSMLVFHIRQFSDTLS